MVATKPESKPYVLWLIHNSRSQIDGSKHYGGMFSDFDSLRAEIETHMDSLIATTWDSRQDVIDNYGSDPEDEPEWLSNDLAWPVYECDGNTFETEEAMYDYAAERVELGSFEPLATADRDGLREIAEAEWHLNTEALPDGLLTEGEEPNEDLDYHDGETWITVLHGESGDERQIEFDDTVAAAVIAHLWPYPERPASEIYWQMAQERARVSTCRATEGRRAEQEQQKRLAAIYEEAHRKLDANGIKTAEKFDTLINDPDPDPSHMPHQLRTWLVGLDRAVVCKQLVGNSTRQGE